MFFGRSARLSKAAHGAMADKAQGAGMPLCGVAVCFTQPQEPFGLRTVPISGRPVPLGVSDSVVIVARHESSGWALY